MRYYQEQESEEASIGRNRSILPSVTRIGDFCTLGNFLKTQATFNLPKSPTFLGNFCKGVKINRFWVTFIDFCQADSTIKGRDNTTKNETVR